MFATSASAQPWLAPPEPAVRPHLPARVEIDADNNRVDDRIDRRVGALRRQLATEKNAARRQRLAGKLAAPTRIEVVFHEQVAQQQIDAFLVLGGQIRHVYRSVSYGWSGTLPAASIDALPAALGPSLLVVSEETDAQLHMDEATRTGRVRPIWAPGFAGTANGIAGTSDITIGVMDSGVDDSHPDLAGRLEYWKDYTGDNEANPRDVLQHGSHVAGIALGSGSVFGSGNGTLRYTDSGNLAGVSANAFYLSGVHLPSVPLTFNLSSTWVGGGSTLLRVAARTNGVSGGFISICNTLSGSSPLTLNCNSTGNVTQIYSSALPQNSGGSVGRYATTVSIGPYSGVGDGFNSFRGVAPGARWAGAKVFTNAGSGSSGTIGAAMDDLVTQRSAHDIKVVNMSLGLIGAPGVDAALRAKANTMVNNGIVVVSSAGNDGPGTAPASTTDDPGRAALVLTVGATNDANALTRYTSSGFASPGSDEDVKPDLLAPGGSDYYSQIMSVDSNDADAEVSSFADRVENDYLNIKGTSMSAPFAAGSAALVVDAMQKAGAQWSFSSSSQPLFVKMMLCASSTETNANREASSGTNPTLGRAAAPKDLYEGYGLMNPDAAVEAVSQVYSGGSLGGSTTGGAFDRRAWGRKLGITGGPAVTLTLTVPVTADYDLYLYSATPDAKGNPVIRASSTNAGLGTDESITFTPTSTETRYLFVKRVSGSGDWSLTSGTAQTSCGDGSKSGGEQCDDGNQVGGDCCSADCKYETNGSPCDDGLFCTATDTCSSGVCSGTGNPCSTGGVCNNTCSEANDDCASPFGLACTNDSNPCTVDQCDGQGSCTHPAGNSGAVCRAAAGGCDVAETCTGLLTTCPLDLYALSLTPCRASAGVCDVGESCSGLSPNCPADSYLGSATVCRSSAGVCDLEERCSGASASCPSNTLAGSATVCREASGVCDAEETCSGSSASCPVNGYASASTVCRGSNGICDAEETCTGTSASCPANVLAGSTTVCRAASGACDVEETCTGSSASCPANEFAPGATVCRGASGACDVEETCTGTSASCPANGFASSSTTCRGASGACDVQETCSGTSASCPADGVAGTTTTCRTSAGECDVAETCNGTAKTCPANAFAPEDTACSSDSNACTSDICNGSSATCQHVSGACESCGDGNLDNGEVCDDGNTAGGDCCSSTCTSAAGNGTPCNDGQYCNGADTCQAGACSQHEGDPCDGADGDDDCSETCNEAADACSANDPNASGCDDGLYCNGADTCQSGSCSQHAGDPCAGPDGDDDCSESCKESNDTCTTNDADASPCNDGLYCNGADTCKSGACSQHAGDPCAGPDGDGNCAESCNEGADDCTAADANGSACSDNAFCNGADTCSGGACSQHAGNPCAGADGDGDCTESCSEGGDNCSAADPDGSACDDGLPCTVSDSCTAGTCGDDSSAQLCPGSTTTSTTLPGAMCGDANEDGTITAGDALFSLRTAVGTAECAVELCDYNGDERVSATDASLILRTAVGQNVAPKCPGTIAGLASVTSTLPTTTTTLSDDGL